MEVTLPEFERVGMMVVDDVILDRYWYGPTSRISPEAPVPVAKVDTTKERPGGVVNVAVNIAFLGTNARLVRLMGIDDVAYTLSKLLADVNVKCNSVSVPTHPTTTKLRVLSCSQQLIRPDSEEGLEGTDPQPLHERANQTLSSIGALALSDYAKGVLANVQQMIQLARKAGIPVPIDPKGIDFERYRGTTLLTSSLSESEAVVDKCKAEEEIVEHGMKLIADYELSALLVTRSEQGMSLLQPGKAPLHIPIQVQEVYDVTGAGDTVIGILAAMLAAGNSLKEACLFTNVAAGVTAGRLGTSTVSPIELENAACGRVDTGFDVMAEEELELAVAAARKRGGKVVMTNGAFDTLHAGYISYLVNARKLDDRSIVAINSDASAKRLKGNFRSVNLPEQRVIVLDALETVDWVVSFEEDTPQRLIARILPDLLAKGGDYKPEGIAGSKEVWANGGEVLVLNFEDGCSATNIIKKIQQDRKGQPESGLQISLRTWQAY